MIVVDTNVLAYRFIRGSRSVAAEQLAQRDPEWTAPLLWQSEFRNVLAGSIRRGLTSVDEAARLMHHVAGSLRGGVHTVSDHAVLALVARSKCTAYDCEFVALAQALDVLLVTDDRAILLAFPAQCRSLDDAVKHGLER